MSRVLEQVWSEQFLFNFKVIKNEVNTIEKWHGNKRSVFCGKDKDEEDLGLPKQL